MIKRAYKGESLGILGRNGCGKSTLLKILADIIKPTKGYTICNAQLKKSLLALGLGFRPDLSGKDNALLSGMLAGLTKKQAAKSLKKISDFSELGEFFNQPVRTYSAGMRARLGFSTAIMNNVDILLIDEVLSVGDMHFRNKAQDAIKSQITGEQTVVFVSHIPEQVTKICDRALWLEGGVVQKEGATATVKEAYNQFMRKLDDATTY